MECHRTERDIVKRITSAPSDQRRRDRSAKSLPAKKNRKGIYTQLPITYEEISQNANAKWQRVKRISCEESGGIRK